MFLWEEEVASVSPPPDTLDEWKPGTVYPVPVCSVPSTFVPEEVNGVNELEKFIGLRICVDVPCRCQDRRVAQ